MDDKLNKLEFLRDGYWKLFTKTGSIYDYGKYRSARELAKARRQELADEQSFQQ